MGSHVSGEGPRASGSHTRDVLDAIRRIVQALRESSSLAESRVGLTGAQLFVLRAVAEAPDLSLNALAERTRTHQSSVSAVVARLVGEGLLLKRTAIGDARRAAIRLTSNGRRRLNGAPPTAQEWLVAAVDLLPATERARLAGTLGRLVQGMALPRKRPTMFFEEPSTRQVRRRANA